MLLTFIYLAVVGCALAQKSPYAPNRSFPGLLPRFRQDAEESDLTDRLGVPSTTLAPDLQGSLNDDKLVARVAEWPEEHQPFWFKNRQVVNSQIHHSIDGTRDDIRFEEKQHTKNDRKNEFEEQKIREQQQRLHEQKIQQQLEQQHLQEQIEQQRLQEQVEQQRLREQIEQQRIKEEIEEQRLKEELERQRLKEERERERLEEEREQQRLKQERERQRILHHQQISQIQHEQHDFVHQNQFTKDDPHSFEEHREETPLWKTQKEINSGMRVNENSFKPTEPPKKKKKFWIF